MLSAKEAAPELLLARSWRHGPRAGPRGSSGTAWPESIGGVGWAFNVFGGRPKFGLYALCAEEGHFLRFEPNVGRFLRFTHIWMK